MTQRGAYFARSHVNDSSPARGAVEWQWNLDYNVTTVVAAGMEICTSASTPSRSGARMVSPRPPETAAFRIPSRFSLGERETRPSQTQTLPSFNMAMQHLYDLEPHVTRAVVAVSDFLNRRL
jgi:hypothetical protein